MNNLTTTHSDEEVIKWRVISRGKLINVLTFAAASTWKRLGTVPVSILPSIVTNLRVMSWETSQNGYLEGSYQQENEDGTRWRCVCWAGGGRWVSRVDAAHLSLILLLLLFTSFGPLHHFYRRGAYFGYVIMTLHVQVWQWVGTYSFTGEVGNPEPYSILKNG